MRVLPLILTAAFIAPVAFAHPDPASQSVSQAASKSAPATPKANQTAKLPSQAEINRMKDQMPDMNALMSGMMEIMKDEKLQSTLRGSAEAMKDHMPDMTASRLDNGLPDMNAMMGAMLSMMGDEAVMGDMLSALEPLQGQMQGLMQNAAPTMPNAAAPLPKDRPAPELPPLPKP